MSRLPARVMNDEAIDAELAALGREWDDLRGGDEELGGGSPGEWLYERMMEMENEQTRRTHNIVGKSKAER